jgi:hypothetical protein
MSVKPRCARVASGGPGAAYSVAYFRSPQSAAVHTLIRRAGLAAGWGERGGCGA